MPTDSGNWPFGHYSGDSFTFFSHFISHTSTLLNISLNIIVSCCCCSSFLFTPSIWHRSFFVSVKAKKEEAEAKRIEEEQAASRRAAEEAERQRKEAEERARVEAEAVAKKKAEEEEQASVKQREEAEKMAEEEAKKRAEEEALAQTEAATVEAASIAIRPSVVEGQSNKADRASLEERAQKEGYITKAPTSGKQGLFKRDRRRYFKLDKTQLSFYQDASMFDLLKQFTVEGEAVEEAGGEHELKVPVSSTAFGSRLSLLKFESAAELAEWKEALSAAAQLAAI